MRRCSVKSLLVAVGPEEERSAVKLARGLSPGGYGGAPHLRVESVNSALHLCRHGPLLKLQLSGVHHGAKAVEM